MRHTQMLHKDLKNDYEKTQNYNISYSLDTL